MRRLDVPARLAERGQQLLDGLNALLEQINAPSWLQSAGHPSWSFLLIGDSANHSSWLLKSYFIQVLCKRGILCRHGRVLGRRWITTLRKLPTSRPSTPSRPATAAGGR